VYPFIFAPDSDWTANVCSEVHEGYEIAGDWGEQGNPSSGGDWLQLSITNVQTSIMIADGASECA
jgi:hypothetical protein